MAWASPVRAEKTRARPVTTLLRSSPNSSSSKSAEILPALDEDGRMHFDTAGVKHAIDLGIVVQGQFDSWFAGKPYPLTAPEGSAGSGINTVIEHSPASSRIILYASNDFLDDQVLNAVVSAAGTQYIGPLELFMNTLDWAVQDGELLKIRSGGNFNRTLPAMERNTQTVIESINYAIAAILLLALSLAHWFLKILRKRQYARALSAGSSI